jgi:hypothetical protein
MYQDMYQVTLLLTARLTSGHWQSPWHRDVTIRVARFIVYALCKFIMCVRLLGARGGGRLVMIVAQGVKCSI